MAGRGRQLTGALFPYLRLAKLPLCFLVGLSALFGAMVAGGTPGRATIVTVFGVFLAACGAASLNSLQEKELDGAMRRTRERPLPRGEIGTLVAGVQAGLLLTFALALLLAAGTAPTTLLTATAVLLYNGVYTPLKRTTSLAIVPGLLSGALPPYIGWLAGGGAPLAFAALLLFALLVLWQVPHVHLILLDNSEDYRCGPLPTLLTCLTAPGLHRLLLPWVGGLVCLMMMFAVLPLAMPTAYRIAIVANALLLPLVLLPLAARARKGGYRSLFLVLNLFILLHMGVVAAGRVAATPQTGTAISTMEESMEIDWAYLRKN